MKMQPDPDRFGCMTCFVRISLTVSQNIRVSSDHDAFLFHKIRMKLKIHPSATHNMPHFRVSLSVKMESRMKINPAMPIPAPAMANNVFSVF